MFSDQVAELAQQCAAFGRIAFGPFTAGQCLVCGFHSACRIGGAAARNRGPGFAGERVIAGEMFAAGGFDPFATDEHFVFLDGFGDCIHDR